MALSYAAQCGCINLTFRSVDENPHRDNWLMKATEEHFLKHCLLLVLYISCVKWFQLFNLWMKSSSAMPIFQVKAE